MTTCWCGSTEFSAFSPEYGVCSQCGTLVSRVGMTGEQLTVRDDETDFYGKQYWLGHQSADLGFPDIHARARNDLTERNLHWLRALLKYKLPPAKVMELGCSHGSFVALLRQAGYEASGVEMSPWVVDFGRMTFDAPIAVGPVELLDIPPGSLDVIALMDVLEHLPDPSATVAHCLGLLKSDGILLIQTPQFKVDMRYEVLRDSNGAFLEQLKADEHLFLFSEQSVVHLFERMGVRHFQFEPAIFDHYDMFLAVSRVPLRAIEPSQAEAALLSTPGGRLSLALLDLRERELRMTQMLRESEADRAARGGQIDSLTALVKESEADRAARGEQIVCLTRLLKESEADRAARGEQIERLTALLKQSEADRTARGEQIERLNIMLKSLEVGRAEHDAGIERLEALRKALEDDHSARGEQIECLTALLKESEADRAARAEQIKRLSVLLEESDADRAARAEQIECLTGLLKESEADRAARAEQIERLTVLLKVAEGDRTGKGEQIAAFNALYRALSARPAFRALEKIAAWPELKELSNRIGKSNEQ